MKRVLIITYYWPPTGGSGVQRWVKFTRYLPEEGWQPVIYTPENPEQLAVDHSLEAEIPSDTEIIKTRIMEPYGLYRKFLKGSGHSKEAVEVNPVNAQKKSFLQKAAMWIRGNFFRPDPRCLWIRPSVKFLKNYLEEHPVDLIVSTGPPQSMHMIGMKLAEETGIPWIADFRDPWTKIFYFKHLSLSKRTEEWHKKMEKRVLDSSTAVVAVSPLVQKEFQEMTGTPVELITNGFDEHDFNPEPCTEAFGGLEKPFIMTHTGLFAADGNPTRLWEVLAEECAEDNMFRSSLEIRLVGKTDAQIIKAIKDAGLADNLTDMGYQPHNIAVEEQRKASMLILPLRKEPEYRAVLPGKVFEYIASHRPIMGIGQPDGAMSMILEDTKTGKVIDWENKDALKKMVEKCWKLHLKGELMLSKSDISRFSRQNLTHRMATLFNEVIK